MDVNEKIAIAWLEQCKNMFTKSNIAFGKFHADVDVLAINFDKNEIWDCEVKIRTSSTNIHERKLDSNNFHEIKRKFYLPERELVIKSLIPDRFFVKKKFIINKSFFTKSFKKQQEWVNKFNEKDIEVIFFEDVVKDLFAYAQKSKHSTNEIIQSYRLLNLYGEK